MPSDFVLCKLEQTRHPVSLYYASWRNAEDTQLQLDLVIIMKVGCLPEAPLGRQWQQ